MKKGHQFYIVVASVDKLKRSLFGEKQCTELSARTWFNRGKKKKGGGLGDRGGKNKPGSPSSKKPTGVQIQHEVGVESPCSKKKPVGGESSFAKQKKEEKAHQRAAQRLHLRIKNGFRGKERELGLYPRIRGRGVVGGSGLGGGFGGKGGFLGGVRLFRLRSLGWEGGPVLFAEIK